MHLGHSRLSLLPWRQRHRTRRPASCLGRSTSIVTRDGWTLAANVFEPQVTAADSKVAIILSAIGASRSRYAPFARHLTETGWTVVTFDYRGIGDSLTHRPDAPSPNLTDWGEQDLHAVIAWVDEHLGPARMVAVAHSIGGQLVALTANRRRLFAVLAVSTPRPFWWLWNGPYRYVVFLFFRVWVPVTVALLDRLPMRVARLSDLPAGVARDWAATSLHLDSTGHDPRYQRQHEGFRQFRAPTLVLSFEDDYYIAPRQAVTQLIDTFYANAPCVRCHIDPAQAGLGAIGHSGFFDGQVPRSWWDEARAWLEDPPAALATPASASRGVPSLLSHVVGRDRLVVTSNSHEPLRATAANHSSSSQASQ